MVLGMGVREICFAFYRTAQRLIIPNLKYSQTIYEEALSKATASAECWLDLGCGRQLLPPWRLEQERALIRRPKICVGLDYDYDSLEKHLSMRNKVRGDISRLPFGDDSFDVVTSNMVFEHLKDPETQLREIFRILRPGGLLLFHTPNSRSYGPIIASVIPERIKRRLIWLLQQRGEDDSFPTFYRINTPTSIGRIAQVTGYEVTYLRLIVSTPLFIMVPPVLFFELFFIRFLMTRLGRPFRSNLIVALRKPNE
jgi:SAM-dependent methyltransferase